jgi:hypothetical protein
MQEHVRPFVCAIAALAFSISAAHAIPITGPWNSATTDPPGGQGNGPITNANTASPTLGDGTSNSAAGDMMDSPFPAITLAAPGDKIIFTGSVTLSGTVNSAATSGTPRTQFRFGLFDGDEDGLDDNGWVGYYMSNKHGNAGTPAGVLARKSAGNTTIYLSATGQTGLASQQGDGTAASLFHDATYAMNLTIERNPAGELLVAATLTGSSGFSQSLSATDTTAAANGTYTFDHLGFLSGSNLGTDLAQFENLDVTFVPEPASLIPLILSALWVRRHRHAV